MVREVCQPGKGFLVIETLVTALLDLSVLLMQSAQVLLPLLTLLIQCAVTL
jgi:hypothetical protein